MKISCLALVPLAAQAALPTNGWFGGRGLALVVKGNKKGFTHATRDGGNDSASFYGEAPKGGTLFRDAAESAKDTAKELKREAKSTYKDVEGKFKGKVDTPSKSDNPVNRVGPFWESKIFKEGGLGFLFGVGSGVCVRKVNQNAAVAVGGVLVAAQYISRTDTFGAGGNLGWPMLNPVHLRPSTRENFGFLFRTGRMVKYTIKESLETTGGFALGLAAGLKTPAS